MATEPTAEEVARKQLVLRQVLAQYDALFVQVNALGKHLISLQSIDRYRLGDTSVDAMKLSRAVYVENVELLLSSIGAGAAALDAMVLLGHESKW